MKSYLVVTPKNKILLGHHSKPHIFISNNATEALVFKINFKFCFSSIIHTLVYWEFLTTFYDIFIRFYYVISLIF